MSHPTPPRKPEDQRQTYRLPDPLLRQLRPRERLMLSAWAVRHFHVSGQQAVQPGPYDLSLTPYWRDVLDDITTPTVRRINIVSAAQTGKTLIDLVTLAYFARERPHDVLYVLPTEPDLQEVFPMKIGPSLEHNCADLLPPGEWIHITDNPTIELRGMTIYGAAASIERQLIRRTTKTVFVDEVDSATEVTALGNLLDLLDERQMAASALDCLTLSKSTPKLESGANWLAYDKQSDRREYWEPCPKCGEYQPLKMGSIVALDGERDEELIRSEDLARLRCVGCGHLIDPTWQGWMADRGVWVCRRERVAEKLPLTKDEIVDRRSLAIAPDAERWRPRIEGPPRRSDHRGYRVWRANTKFDQARWSNLLAKWLEVNRSKDPARLQVFVNSSLAEPWREATEPADEGMLREHIGAFDPGIVQTEARAVLGFIDVQRDSIFYLFRAFGPKMKSWLVRYGTVEVHADRYAAAFDWVYDMAFFEGWPLAGEDAETGQRVRAYAIGIDAGYRQDEVIEYAKRSGIVATKGIDVAQYRVKATTVEGRNSAQPSRLYIVNTKVMKDRIQRLVKTNAEDACWRLHRETGQDYLDHLTSEHLRPKRSNKKVFTWQLRTEGRPNHYLDCEAGIQALITILEERGELSITGLRPTDPTAGVFTPGVRQPPRPSRPRISRGRIRGL